MLREVAEDVPAKEAGILRDQVVKAEDAEKTAGCESLNAPAMPSRSTFRPEKGDR
jgi:hypothetical protein